MLTCVSLNSYVPDHPSTPFCVRLGIVCCNDHLAADGDVREELGNNQGTRGFRLRPLHITYYNIWNIRHGGADHQNFRGELF